MITGLRIPRELCEQMRGDLLRGHAFAAERVGFARAVMGSTVDGKIVLLQSYWSIQDNQYIDDPEVGARINTGAIRDAMQDILTGEGRYGLFHIHLHNLPGRTRMSRTDALEIPKLVKSFRNIRQDVPHGLLILTPNHAYAQVLLPGSNSFQEVSKTTIIGYPMEILL